MKLLKSTFIILLVLYVCESKFRFGLRRIFCVVTSNKTVYNNASCRFKTYSFNSYISFRITLKRRIPNCKVSFTLSRRNSDGYQKIIDLKDVEICKMIRNVEESPLKFVRDVMLYYEHSFAPVGNWLKFCELIGDIYYINGTYANLAAFELYPAGDYMSNYIFHDEIDSKAFNFTLMYHLSKY